MVVLAAFTLDRLSHVVAAKTGKLAKTAQTKNFMRSLLRGRLLRSSEFFHHTLAHGEFLHLAGHGHREIVDETNVTRNLESSDLAVAKCTDFRLGEGLTGPNLDPRAQFLAELSIGNAKHLGCLHFRMPE